MSFFSGLFGGPKTPELPPAPEPPSDDRAAEAAAEEARRRRVQTWMRACTENPVRADELEPVRRDLPYCFVGGVVEDHRRVEPRVHLRPPSA
mgnify:CR=1 FL=1